MALKIAIVRVSDENPSIVTILLEADLREAFQAEMLNIAPKGQEKRLGQLALLAYEAVERRVKEETVHLP